MGGPTNGYVTASLSIQNNLAGRAGTSQGVYAVLEGQSVIAGRVLAQDRTPIAQTQIQARLDAKKSSALRATTDDDGRYKLVAPKDGFYTVQAKSRDAEFKPAKRQVTVRKNRTVRADFKHAKCTADRRGSERLRRSSNGTL